VQVDADFVTGPQAFRDVNAQRNLTLSLL